jgi:mannitol-specific phosphotransferase system IIBC component
MSFLNNAINHAAKIIVKSKTISTQQEKNLFKNELNSLPILTNIILYMMFFTKNDLLNANNASQRHERHESP